MGFVSIRPCQLLTGNEQNEVLVQQATYEPSAEKMSLHRIFRNFRIKDFYWEFEELSLFAYSEILEYLLQRTFSAISE